MVESKRIPHHELFKMESPIGAQPGSRVYHLDALPLLDSSRDGRQKKVIINGKIVDTDMLVDVLTYQPGATSPLHYHKGVEHFFFVYGGRGRIVIEGKEHRLSAGTCVWIQDGDRHKLFADADSELRLLEFFSSGQHETVFLEQACEWASQP